MPARRWVKTALGLGIATNVAKSTNLPVIVFSLEMAHLELSQRILASEARVDSSKLQSGRLTESDWSKVGLAIGRLEVPLFLDDNPQVTVMEIRAKARRIAAQHGGIGLILIDYLQLMSGSGRPENRQLEVSEISRNLEARSDKRPMLADLRESGSIERPHRLANSQLRVALSSHEWPAYSDTVRLRRHPGQSVLALMSPLGPPNELSCSTSRPRCGYRPDRRRHGMRMRRARRCRCWLNAARSLPGSVGGPVRRC